MLCENFLDLCKEKFYDQLNILKYINILDSSSYSKTKDFSVVDSEGSGVYSDANFIISWIDYENDQKLSLINKENFSNACFNASLIHLSSKVTRSIKEGLPYGQIFRELDYIYENLNLIVKDILVVEPDFDNIDQESDEDIDIITSYLKVFADKVELSARDIIKNKFNNFLKEKKDINTMEKVDLEVESSAKDIISMANSYEKSLNRENTLFIENSQEMFRTIKNINDEINLREEDESVSYEYIEIDENDFDDWSDWEKECPDCGSSDICYTGLSVCACNKCGFEWKVEIPQDKTNEYFDEYKKNLKNNQEKRRESFSKRKKRLKDYRNDKKN